MAQHSSDTQLQEEVKEAQMAQHSSDIQLQEEVDRVMRRNIERRQLEDALTTANDKVAELESRFRLPGGAARTDRSPRRSSPSSVRQGSRSRNASPGVAAAPHDSGTRGPPRGTLHAGRVAGGQASSNADAGFPGSHQEEVRYAQSYASITQQPRSVIRQSSPQRAQQSRCRACETAMRCCCPTRGAPAAAVCQPRGGSTSQRRPICPWPRRCLRRRCCRSPRSRRIRGGCRAGGTQVARLPVSLPQLDTSARTPQHPT